MRHIIIGGGRVGRNLAKLLGRDYLIVEKDERTYRELIKNGFNAVLGDATDESLLRRLPIEGAKVILATNDDATNLAVASMVKKLGAEEIIARVEDGEKVEDYLKAGVRAVACEKVVASELMHEITEGRKKYFEVSVTEDNFAGRKLSEISIGEGCTVVVVFRSGMAFKPSPDLKLKSGDVLGIICGKEIRATKKPFEEILVVITDPKRAEETISEAKMIAERFDAELIYLYKSKGTLSCSVVAKNFEELDVNEAIDVIDAFEGKVDLVVTNVMKEKVPALKILERFPVVFAKGKKDYGKILVIVNTSKPEKLLTYASALSNFFGDSTVMFLDKEQLKSSSSLIESPKVKTTVASHNPLVEVIKEVKEGYDLVVFSARNDVGNLSESVLWKIIMDTKSSVMVVE